MKNIVLIGLAAVISIFSMSSCHKHRIKGEGNIVSDTRSIGNITALTADGDIDVEILPAEKNKVVVTGYQNLVPVFETNVSSERLTLRFNDTYYNVRNNNIKVTLYVNNLNGITINGSGNIVMRPDVKSDKMDLKVNGSGVITLEENQIPKMDCQINGSGKLYCRSCIADDVYAKISGSGDMEVTVEHYLEARITGSGTINYWGSPETVTTDISGSGKVKKH